MMCATALRNSAGSASCCFASSQHQPQAGPSNRPLSVPFTSATFVSQSGECSRSGRNHPRVQVGVSPAESQATEGPRPDLRCHAVPLRGTRKSMVEQDTLDWDHMEEAELEKLWEKYGETVVTNPDVLAQEDLDDTDSKEFAVAMAEVADLTKAADVQVLHVAPFVYWTRVMVLVTAFSRPQVNAIGVRLREAALEKFGRKPDNDSDDGTPKSWTVVDFGDVVIHVFLPKEREFYSLDEYYKEAEVVPLPFAKRSLE